jgi:hypothetical protein
VRQRCFDAVLILLCPVALVAETHAALSDPREIARLSLAATERNWCARTNYNYVEREVTQRFGPDGRVQSQDVSLSRIITLDGIPIEQLTEHNGRPPSRDEKAKENAKLEKLQRESPTERSTRLRKEKQEIALLTRDVLQGFDYCLVGTETFNGRPAYVLQAAPRSGYHAESKYGKMILKVEAKIWVDQQDLVWVKVEGNVQQPFSMGVFLARVLQDSHIMLEQTRVSDGTWMPRQIEVRANAKVLFVKSLMIEKILSYSAFRPATGNDDVASLASHD